SRRRHTRSDRDWSSDVCSSDLAMKAPVNPRAMRRAFINGLFTELRVVWPVISALLLAMVVLGLVIGLLEGWSVSESLYFAFVSEIGRASCRESGWIEVGTR